MITAKTQSALEYLMIIALTFVIIIPTTYMLYRFSSESNIKILDSRINEIGRNIVDTAETVYFSGEDSKIVLEINMPKNVIDVNIIANRELIFNMTTETGETERVFFSSSEIPMISDDASSDCTDDGNCKLTDIAGYGAKRVKIESVVIDDENKVLISKFEG